MRRLLVVSGLVAMLLTGCFGNNGKMEAEDLLDFTRIQKSDFSIIIPNSWQEVHPSAITDEDFQTKNVRALFWEKAEDFRGKRAYITLTTEKVPTGTTALEFFSESRDNMSASWFGFVAQSEEEITISSQNTILLTFTAQKEPDSIPVSYWQTFLVKKDTAYVFTAGKSDPVSQETGQTILEILKNIVLL